MFVWVRYCHHITRNSLQIITTNTCSSIEKSGRTPTKRPLVLPTQNNPPFVQEAPSASDTRVLHGQIELFVEDLVISSPSGARVKVLARDVRFLHQRRNLFSFLHELQRKTAAGMPVQGSLISASAAMLVPRADLPGNVAMHEPGARIVDLEGNEQETRHRQQGDIAPWRIVKVQLVLGRVISVVTRS